jgi:sRNA-binding protein
MTRPVLTLKPPPPPAEPAKKSRNALSREAVRFLAELELPLFQRMQKLSVLLPMAVGIRDDIIARVDPALHDEVKKALADIAYSPGYRSAVHVDGARRHNLDGSDAGPVSFEHRADLTMIAETYERMATMAEMREAKGRSSR